MDDTLGYSGRRCIVVGAAAGLGAELTRLLIDLGAEVHTVDATEPDIAEIASFSATDLTAADAIARTIKAIGAIVNNLFNCAPTFATIREVTERVIPNMIDGAAIVSIADGASAEPVARYTAERAPDLVALGIRINSVSGGTAAPRAEDLVRLGGPQSAATGLNFAGSP